MGTLNICPICERQVDEFQFFHGNQLTSVINCISCGQFQLTGDASREISGKPIIDSHIYSGAIRELNERGVNPVIDDLQNLLYQVVVPRNPLEMMDRFLLSVRNQSTRADQHVLLSEHDFPLAYCHDDNEWTWICRQMAELKLIEPWGGSYQFRILPEGWRRLADLSITIRRTDQAFVAMSFDPALEGAFNDGIRSALVDAGYVPFRVDRKEHNEKIDDLIVAEIRNSGLLVADFTGQRNGVYFEAGFGLGLGIPVIWCCKDDEEEKLKLHFDTRQYNHIMWKDPADLKEKLINRINATAPAPNK